VSLIAGRDQARQPLRERLFYCAHCLCRAQGIQPRWATDHHSGQPINQGMTLSRRDWEEMRGSCNSQPGKLRLG
jgi:hypothetical protein